MFWPHKQARSSLGFLTQGTKAHRHTGAKLRNRFSPVLPLLIEILRLRLLGDNIFEIQCNSVRFRGEMLFYF